MVYRLERVVPKGKNGLVDAWRSSLCLFGLLLTVSFVRSTVVNLGVVWLKSVLNFNSLSDFFAVVFHIV